MRIDSSGNLLVGKTAFDTNTAGFEARSTGFIGVTRADVGAYFTRLTTDGDIIQFRKDAATVGVVNVTSGSIIFGRGDTALGFNDALDAVYPMDTNGTNRDNAIDLGRSSVRFNDIYATNGTIQTSDRNEKQDIEALSDAEQRVAVACKGLLRKFRWKSKVEEKGDDARIHFGIIAQDLQAAFEAEGLDAGRYAMFISSTWTDEETGEERTKMTVWTIAQLERNTSDGGVVVAHWRATATDGDYSASSYGTCGFTPDPTAPDFVPFESLTEADVLAWVYESVDKDSVEASLASQIEDQKAPQTMAGVPWQ
jgi:hypothetical protein